MAKSEDLSRIEEFADWFKLEGDDRNDFVTKGMEKLGYKLKTILDFDEPEGSGAPVTQGFFGSSRQSNGPSSQGGQSRQASGGGQYR